jgi:ribosomal protein S18 acetylase RimI-like enzyme
VIEYRTFSNSDPARVVALWNGCPLGRGAATGVSVDVFETLNFAQPYFDRNGLILACEGNQVVGFLHAGFGANADESALSHESGMICAVLVHPTFRRHGIARELVTRAEAYLRRLGAQSIYAGPSEPRDPFFFGLYGGSCPSGFLESDVDAAPFFTALGYEPVERHAVLQCDLTRQRTPMSYRFANVRRKMELAISAEPEHVTWWWATRYGRLEDTLQFVLRSKDDPGDMAEVTVSALDLYLTPWQQRAVGITHLRTRETELRKGYAQALLIETCRRLKDELVTLAEAHALESNTPVLKLLESCGFMRIDTGVVYRRKAT